MPVIRVYKHRLEKLVGKQFSIDELEDLLFNLKCEVSIAEEGILEIELNSDRPDMLITEGIARVLKGVLEIEVGIPKYEAIDTGIKVIVEPPSTRPYIAVAVVYNVNIDYELFEELIQFQEKLHMTYGRKRRRIAIGLHDLDKLPSKSLYYKEVDIDSTKFMPLNESREYTAREILKNIKQGIEYGDISLRDGKYHPMLFAGDKVIAMPPVINADITRIEPGTRSLLIDVTGTDLKAVEEAIDILTTTLAESGGKIGRVEVHYPDKILTYPKLRTEKIPLDINYVYKVLGLKLSTNDIKYYLERMRFNAEVADEERVIVTIPPFRVDILHPVDLIEDIAMSIGYENIEPEPVKPMTPKPISSKYRFINALRELLVGLGFQELHLYMLTSSKDIEELGLQEKYVVIANPVTEELDIVRPTMINQILRALKVNQHIDMPVKIYSIGDTVVIDENKETMTDERTKLALAYMAGKASFEDLQAPLYAAFRYLDLDIKTVRGEHKLTIDGRTAKVIIEGEERGFIGEVKPEILEKMSIKLPVVLGELDITGLWSKHK